MVLQAGAKLPVWGRADPGETVVVKLAGQELAATADQQGRWRVVFEPIASDSPLEMQISSSGSDKTITIRDILIGEVWICSGQSNMDWPVRAALEPAKEIAEADYPQIRLFIVHNRASSQPQEDLVGQWRVCSPKTVGDFSAVGYFFGRKLHRHLKTPVGLIKSAWGGTTGEAWTDLDSLKADPVLQSIVQRYEQSLPRAAELRVEYEKKLAEWMELATHKDPADSKTSEGWAGIEFDDSAWKSIDLPGTFEGCTGQDVDGAVWFRRAVEVPEAWAGRELELNLGVVDDYDVAFFNGVRVGSTGPDTPRAWMVHRSYIVPAELVRAGHNLLAVRVFDTGGSGGICGPVEAMNLQPRAKPQADAAATIAPIPLHGRWKYAIELALEPKRHIPPPPSPPAGPDTPYAPANLYNGMIHPLAGLAIRGVIWYQGESNCERAFQYRTLLPAMIRGWRRAWGQGDFAFLIVQLTSFHAPATQPVEPSTWAELREAQLLTTRSVPNTALAVTIDVGDADDIHPRNKQEVGRRLALLAMKEVYGKDVVASGPIFRSMTIEENKVKLKFDQVGTGLKARDQCLNGFAIAGEDRNFVCAEAKLAGEACDTVIVWSEKVPKPVAVRYGWADNPQATLVNSEGLPASPFRTDDWPGVTDERR